tara:strand:+ start:2061 stop:2564 length:504 start_codon:yes stop_codon:yes gene_type:complete
MWLIIKFDKSEINTLRYELMKKLGNDTVIFIPKVKIELFKKNNKTYSREINLLGNYLFCYHRNFINMSNINLLQYTKGVKYVLKEFLYSQNNIKEFISKCRAHENKDGYIKPSFFDLNLNKKFKFLSGPFINFIFYVIDENKSSFNIVLNKFKTTVSKEKYLFRPEV